MKNIQGGIYGRTDKTKTKRYRGVGAFIVGMVFVAIQNIFYFQRKELP